MSKIRTLRPGDPEFTVVDGIIIAQRAGVEILSECPREYRQIIAACIDRGWLKPVAAVYEHELVFNKLKG